jgi:hypothetical protein
MKRVNGGGSCDIEGERQPWTQGLFGRYNDDRLDEMKELIERNVREEGERMR